jgi:hypothetical protein
MSRAWEGFSQRNKRMSFLLIQDENIVGVFPCENKKKTEIHNERFFPRAAKARGKNFQEQKTPRKAAFF